MRAWLALLLLIAASRSVQSSEWIFYNEITGVLQKEDPGGVPFVDEHGVKYWLSDSGERLASDPHAAQYVWIENYSADLKRAFYTNLITKEATWDKPADMAWRRMRVQED